MRVVGLTNLIRCALLIALPGIGSAQVIGTGRGIGRSTMPGRINREPGIVIPKVVNPVNILLLHRPELALSDTQFMKIVVIKRALDSTNAPFLRRLDSLERLFKPGPLFSTPSRERRDSLAEANAVARETLGAVRENNSTARESAWALLSAQQQATANGLESAAERAIAEEELKRKGRGG